LWCALHRRALAAKQSLSRRVAVCGGVTMLHAIVPAADRRNSGGMAGFIASWRAASSRETARAPASAVVHPAPMSSELLLIHATGVCALALNVVALAHPCERALRVQSGLAGVIWTLNNLLLGAHTAAALSLVSAGRTATSAVTLSAHENIRRAAFAGFLVLTLLMGALTWQGWPSALMVLASVLSTFAVFYLRGRALRLAMLLVSALWMHNAWLYDSWEQMAANVLTAAAALVGARRVERAIEGDSATGGCKPSPAAASS
jgi:hypothetical protein